MILTLAALVMLHVPPLAGAPKPAPVLPFAEVTAVGGTVVVVGKDFRATAARLVLSSDGKQLELHGSASEPATFASGSNELAGKRIIYTTADGSLRVYDTGSITESKPRAK